MHSAAMYNGDNLNKSPTLHDVSLVSEQTFLPDKPARQRQRDGKEYRYEICRNISADPHVSITHVRRRLWPTRHSRSEI